MLHCSNFQWKGFTSLHFIKHLLKVAGLIIPRWEFLSRSAVSNSWGDSPSRKGGCGCRKVRSQHPFRLFAQQLWILAEYLTPEHSLGLKPWQQPVLFWISTTGFSSADPLKINILPKGLAVVVAGKKFPSYAVSWNYSMCWAHREWVFAGAACGVGSGCALLFFVCFKGFTRSQPPQADHEWRGRVPPVWHHCALGEGQSWGQRLRGTEDGGAIS